MRLAVVAAVLLVALGTLAGPAAAKKRIDKVRIFVFAEPDNHDGFLGGIVPAALRDSVNDTREAIYQYGLVRHWRTDKREEAAILVQIIGREEVNGELRVRAHITTLDGRASDLIGASIHQWKQSAKQLVDQLMDWVKMHESELPLPKEDAP